jgi:hypothetical protein
MNMVEEVQSDIFVIPDTQKSFLKRIVPLSAFIGGLCCFAPVVLVILGISSVTFAISLTDILYGQYVWAFRGLAFLFLGMGLLWYFYKKENICSLDEARKKKQLIINISLTSVIILTFSYVIWTYVIVEILGIYLGLW